ncbi:MAG TPA: valine--tRNA ligase [Armatimonadota bacterium]|jgi:valyl-tRNA synthetase
MTELAKAYEPTAVEAKWLGIWDEGGYFRAEVDHSRTPYCITIPPPNVTGELHLGHGLQHAIHDTLIRWKRMSGFNTLCVPGTDHASISTTIKVRDSLRAQGINPVEIGRDEFLKHAWAWKELYGGKIIGQLKALGCSYDWSRERFTMDDRYYRAVTESFVRLYNDGFIYRGKRVVNWCVKDGTTLSDLEVEHDDEVSSLWHLRYPLADGSGSVVVATTRPETMLGDTAVAVNSRDPRWNGLIGKTVRLPLMDRDIPVIADDILVDLEFGTGVVKVTPAHDPNDYQAGLRNNLEQISVIGEDGKMTEAAGAYAGLDRFACRERVVADLEALGLLEKIEDYTHAVGHCARCHTIIEPLLLDQWWCREKDLAKRTLGVIGEGQVTYFPERFAQQTAQWIENLRDWNISRQLWWGHRIPAYFCKDCREITVQATAPDRCPKCGGAVVQDDDTLDTWFSSALWPMAVLGWPDKTPELEYFYPTNLMITARDILYLWIARMISMSEHYLDKIPYNDVYVHATIQATDGRRMSKSLGTGVDPLEMIAKYGTDATRLGLLFMAAKGQDVRFNESRMAESRNFANKLWNATRFVLMNVEEGFTHPAFEGGFDPAKIATLNAADRWIISRLSATTEAVAASLEAYNLDDAGRAIYEFVWNEYCDWYVEMAKTRLQGPDRADAQAVLIGVLEQTLRLLHPFMPFVTEELYAAVQSGAPACASPTPLIVAQYPVAQPSWRNLAAEEEMLAAFGVVEALRSVRAAINIPPGQPITATICPVNGTDAALADAGWLIKHLARAEVNMASERPAKSWPAHSPAAEIYVPVEGLLDIPVATAKANKDLLAIEKDLQRTQGKLGNQAFVGKAPPEVIEKERAIEIELLGKQSALKDRLTLLESLA